MNRMADPGSELQLVHQFQSGDSAAFETLVQRYQNLVTSIAYSALGDFDRSLDVAQQAFVTAWRKSAELQQPEKFVAWLSAITRNIARNEKRKTRGERSLENIAEQSPATVGQEQETPPDALMAQEQAELIWSVLEQLPENYREPLVLFYRENQSVSEVARQLALSEDAVKQRLSRGRAMIKDELAAIVEQSLEQTRPGATFAASVIGLIGAKAMISKIGATAVSATAAKGSGSLLGSLKLGSSASLFGAIAGPIIGVLGGIYGSKKSLDAATSDEERRLLWRMIIISHLFVVGMLAVYFTIMLAAPHIFRSIPFQLVFWSIHVTTTIVMVIAGNARWREIKQRNETPEERQAIRDAWTNQPSPAVVAGNMAGAMLGCWCWLPLTAGIAGDWVSLGIALVVIAGLVTWFTVRAFKTTNVIAQINLTRNGVVAAVLCQVVFVSLRWDAWNQQLLGRFINVQFPSWGIVLLLLAMMAILVLVMERRKRFVAEMLQDVPR